MGCTSILFSDEPRHVIFRPYLVYGSSVFLLLSVFFFFVIFGWPGGPIGCIYEEPHHGCYCEAFDLEAVEDGDPGVRQPVNTWSSLFSILTSGFIAWRLSQDRKILCEHEQESRQSNNGNNPQRHPSPPPPQVAFHHEVSEITLDEARDTRTTSRHDDEEPFQNVMRSKNLIADWYVLTAVFNGLGKMYFHGSLLRWATYVDGVSSNFFFAFLPWYTFRRIHHSPNADINFWIGYFITVVLISCAQMIFGSLLAAHILMIFYLFMELYIFATSGIFLGKGWRPKCFWCLGFGVWLVGTVFWWASQTGRTMCDPDSPWQIHGLVWHPLVNVALMFLYLYWRDAGDVPSVVEQPPERQEQPAQELAVRAKARHYSPDRGEAASWVGVRAAQEKSKAKSQSAGY